jgi:hypothetical protein
MFAGRLSRVNQCQQTRSPATLRAAWWCLSFSRLPSSVSLCPEARRKRCDKKPSDRRSFSPAAARVHAVKSPGNAPAVTHGGVIASGRSLQGFQAPSQPTCRAVRQSKTHRSGPSSILVELGGCRVLIAMTLSMPCADPRADGTRQHKASRAADPSGHRFSLGFCSPRPAPSFNVAASRVEGRPSLAAVCRPRATSQRPSARPLHLDRSIRPTRVEGRS